MSSILHKHNKMSEDLQTSLATYGILRETVTQNHTKHSNQAPHYFGIKETPSTYELLFTDDLRNLDKHEGMELALLAPNTQEFNLLAPKKIVGELNTRDPKTIRAYIERIVDEC